MTDVTNNNGNSREELIARGVIGVILLLFFTLALLQGEAKADTDCKFNVSVASKHYVKSPEGFEFNEFNPGGGVQCGPEGKSYYGIAGSYFNSYATWTYYAGIGYTKQIARYVSVGVDVGGVVGYDDEQLPVTFGPVAPMLSPYIVVGTEHIGVKSHLLPGAVTLEFQISY